MSGQTEFGFRLALLASLIVTRPHTGCSSAFATTGTHKVGAAFHEVPDLAREFSGCFQLVTLITSLLVASLAETLIFAQHPLAVGVLPSRLCPGTHVANLNHTFSTPSFLIWLRPLFV